MTKPIPLFRAVATATAVLGACALACALQGTYACPAAAFTPPSKSSGESAPLNLNSASSATHTSSGGASLVRTIVGLAIVIAVIWGLAWIMRQVKSGREPQIATAGLASVAALTLGSGRTVHLVRAGSDYVLLGSAEHGVVPIHRYTEEQAREAGLLADTAVGNEIVPAGSRSSTRRQITAGSGQNGSDPMRMSSPSGLVERLREWTVRR
jgi:flagellar protein FliO/FliZ